ncbi:MAG TPA: site-2 protease family protein [Fimbriimonadaceae bacterium]|jgi:hypothetical protein
MKKFEQLLRKNGVVLAVTVTAVFVILFGIASEASYKVIIAVLLLLFFGVPLVILVGYLATLPVIAFHELGHLVAGKLVGYKFNYVSVSHFVFWKSGGTLCISYRKDFPKLGGLTKMSTGPKEDAGSYIIFVMGGLFASLLLFGGILMVDVFQHPLDAFNGNTDPNILWDDALLLLNLYTLLVAMGSLIPHVSGRYPSDMHQIVSVLKNPNLVRLKNLRAKIQEHFKNGHRGRELEAQDITGCLQFSTTEDEIRMSNFYAYDYFLDSGQYKLAAEAIERGFQVSKSGKSLKDPYAKLVCLEFAYMNALDGNLSVAQEAYALSDKDPSAWPTQKDRAYAAILMAQGNCDQAKAAADRAEAHIRGLAETPSDSSQAELEWISFALEGLPQTPPQETPNEN